MTKKTSSKTSQSSVRVRYESTDVAYASQFVINANPEDITINCSAGYITDPNTGENLLPIHSRIVLTPSGAKRLIETLNQALNNSNKKSSTATTSQAGLATDTEAKIPKIN